MDVEFLSSDPRMDNMTAFYETPRNDTLRLSFEKADGSSEGFDQEVAEIFRRSF